jgi:hypothetical protein
LAYNYVRDAAMVWAGVGFHHDEGSAGITDHANVPSPFNFNIAIETLNHIS